MLAEICAYSSNFLDFFSISEIYMKNQIMMCMHPNNNYILVFFYRRIILVTGIPQLECRIE